MTETIQQTRVLAWHAAFTVAAGAAAFAFASPRFSASLLLGAALQTLNFRGLFGIAQRAFAIKARAASGFALRLPLFGALVYVALRAGADAAGLLCGISALVPAVVIAAWQSRPPVVPASELPALGPDDPSWEQWSPWLARERDADSSEDKP